MEDELSPMIKAWELERADSLQIKKAKELIESLKVRKAEAERE